MRPLAAIPSFGFIHKIFSMANCVISDLPFMGQVQNKYSVQDAQPTEPCIASLNGYGAEFKRTEKLKPFAHFLKITGMPVKLKVVKTVQHFRPPPASGMMV